MLHDQPAAVLLEFRIQFAQAGVNESDPPVQAAMGQQRVEDILVKNENAEYLLGAGERVMQCCMVEAPQVTAEPNERAVVSGHEMVGYKIERQAGQCNGAAVMACNAAKMRPMAKQGKSHSAKTTAPGAGRVDFFPNLPDLQLADHFLIAMPSMLDPVFGGTVVYLCEHNSDGALGMIINRPTDMTMGVLFERLELSLEIGAHDGMSPSGKPVLFGGPVQVERGFVLHAPRERYSSSLAVSDDVVLTTSRDVLEQVAAGNGPERLIITLGCAGWSAGQLEEEILRNGWLTVKADPAILFDVPIEERFSAAMHLLGFDPADLAGEAGHA